MRSCTEFPALENFWKTENQSVYYMCTTADRCLGNTRKLCLIDIFKRKPINQSFVAMFVLPAMILEIQCQTIVLSFIDTSFLELGIVKPH